VGSEQIGRLMCAAILVAVLASVAPAYAQVRQFDVPSEDAGKSIPEFARQARIQVMAPGDQLHGVITPPIKGSYDVFAALDLMLKGTDLKVSHSVEGVVTISPRETKKREERAEMSPKNSTSVLALLLSAIGSLGMTSANAQTSAGAAAAEAAPSIETVTVTGSRISIQGYQQPTPVTVVNAADLDRDAYTDLDQALVQLPSVGVSATLGNGVGAADLSQADAGLSTVNLRNLGVDRTLVLFDNQRVGSSNLLYGGVDLNLLPSELVSRVDVVTGGASAAYGSDAVAGVVNLVLNKTFTGVKANLEFADASNVENKQIKAALTYGDDFDGGRGHFIISGAHVWSGDPVFQGQMNWFNNGQLVQNPKATSSNGLPYYVTARNTGVAEFTQGGLITGNTAGGVGGTVTANSLAGTQFLINGSTAAFNFGTINAVNPNVCYGGCSASAQTSTNATDMLAVPYHSSTLFAYGSYKLTTDIQASVQLNYGDFAEENSGTPRTTTVTVAADNAFLPASIASQFGTLSNGYNAATGAGGTAAAPTQSLKVGTINTNNTPVGDYNLADICNEAGMPCVRVYRNFTRGVFTLDGALADDWSWNVYAEASQMRQRQIAAQDNYGPHYNFAVDAVKVTSTNVGKSGLPLGSIQCRAVLLGNPAAAGCVPLDILGTGVASGAGIQYVNPGTDPNSGILNRELVILNQDVFSGSMQGKLPWGLPAGNVAVAFGGEYRHEQGGQYDIPAIDLTAPYPAGNFSPYSGQYEVEEGFLEADVPLLKNYIVEDLNANAAGRITNYSTSGLVETWKLGLTSQVDDNIKLRGTWSLDIRAPMISELFSPGQIGIGQVQYPVNGPSYQAETSSGGNPALQPEKAVTTTVGVVLTPQFIEGLSVSLDWYRINIHQGIYTTGSQTEINRCLEGQTVYCQFLHFSPNQFGGAMPYLIDTIPANAAGISTSGFDLEANYVMGLFDGTLSWALRGNYTDEYTQNAIGVTYDSAGCMGPTPLAYACTNMPKARGTLAATYTEGPWSGTIQGRFFGAAVLTNGVENLPSSITRGSLSASGVLTQGIVNGNEIADNDVNAVGYMDARLSYRWNSNITFYSAVDNLTDVPRPEFGSNAVYDVLGRTWRAGVRFSY
jgi:iron complex outermembrane receptor protein